MAAEHDEFDCTCDGGLPAICRCQCPDCLRRRNREARLARLQELEERLQKGGIEPQLMADLVVKYAMPRELAEAIWKVLEERFPEKIEEVVKGLVKRFLKGLRLQSEVWGSSVEDL